MHIKQVSAAEMRRLETVTIAQDRRADQLLVEPGERMLSKFGNLKCFTDKEMFIIGRDGSIMFQGRRP